MFRTTVRRLLELEDDIHVVETNAGDRSLPSVSLRQRQDLEEVHCADSPAIGGATKTAARTEPFPAPPAGNAWLSPGTGRPTPQGLWHRPDGREPSTQARSCRSAEERY
jgi:hypothetical protein